ncbi:L,D-transpeptidase [Streptomyces sp. NBC_00847]|uniref:L,D-transpeptidase family protein n=1 Tax=Streptomyces sp. NBC_00847 TaxID=2975850 RepID=UPI00338DD1CD
MNYDEKAPGKRDVTHGWIGLRTADAKWLYAKVKPGTVFSVSWCPDRQRSPRRGAPSPAGAPTGNVRPIGACRGTG